jgi:hypothetical protein
VKVTKMINVADVGRPVNPRIVETQLSGAATMQFGFTMQEKIELDGGQITNASFADYKIPSIVDIPRTMQNEAVESEQGTGPFGAKGVGESGTFGVSPAIASVSPSCRSPPRRFSGRCARPKAGRWRIEMNLGCSGCGTFGLLPPSLAGEGWGGGRHRGRHTHALSLTLSRKRERGRCGASRHNVSAEFAELQ